MHSISKVFKQYFLSFLLIFMVPVIFIIASLFCISYDIFAKELREKAITTTDLSIASLNNELENCLLIAKNLKKDAHFTKTLFNYISANPFIHDVIVSFKDDPYLYSSSTKMDTASFYSRYTSDTYSPASLKNLMTNLSEPLFIDSMLYEDEEYFALLIPLISSLEQVGCTVFLFEPSIFYASLFEELGSSRKFYFLDKLHLEDSFASIDLSYLPSLNHEAFMQNLLLIPKVYESFITDSNSHVIYTSRPFPYVHNLILLSTISHQEVFSSLYFLLFIMLSSIVVAFIFSLICSYHMAQHNYTSIEEMTYSLTKLKKGYGALKDEMNKHIPIKKYFLLNQLINGNIINIPAFTQNCMELGIDLTAPYHGIMLVKSQSSSFTIDHTILGATESFQKNKILYHYIIQHIHPYTDIYLVGTSSNMNLSTLTLPEATLYFGPFSKRLSHIPKSYIDARTLSEFEKTNLESPSPVEILFEDYKASLRQLSTYLQVKNFKEIPSLIFTTLDSLEANSLPFPLQKVICTEIIMLFNNYIDRQDDLIPYEQLDLLSLFKVESFEALKEIIVEVTSEMLEIIICYHDSLIIEPSITLIKDLIKNHFDEQGLGAEQLALHFHIIPSYLEEYFYKQTKLTLNDYINQIRLEKAQILLQTTPYSLKIIAHQVGFSHVSSFISCFKSHYHCTPGQYRNRLHQG